MDRLNPRYGRLIGEEPTSPQPVDRSIVDDQGMQVSPLLTASAAAPPPSPGLMMAKTSWDYQHNGSQGYQTARLAGADIVHFCYTEFPVVPSQWIDRFVCYNSYRISTGEFLQPFNGAMLSLGNTARGGYTNLAVDKDNAAHVAFHQFADDTSSSYSTWHVYLPTPGVAMHSDDHLPSLSQYGDEIHARIEVQQNQGGRDIYHMIAYDEGQYSSPESPVVYWRYNGTAWAGPVAIDSSATLGHVIAAGPNSDKVAIVLHSDREPQFHGVNNVAYYESQTEGAGWIDGSELGDANKRFITNYTDSSGPQAYLHISTTYDNSGVLQVIWDEQRVANATNDVAIRHWNSTRNSIRPVALGYWPSPFSSGANNLNLAKMTLGIGDGATLCAGGSESNRDYLYAVYTQFAGPTATEQTDYSINGYYNGELYLTVSRDGGFNWSRPANLTDTKTPDCNPGSGSPQNGGQPPRPDSVCRSEHWATIGKIVHDIDIFYISDIDAGAIPFSEGFWEMNPVMYLRLPGGTIDAPFVCPLNTPNFVSTLSAPGGCGYHATFWEYDMETLSLTNPGYVTIDGQVSIVYTNPANPPANPPANWLTVGGVESVPFTILAGEPDRQLPVRMDPTLLADGVYQAEIRITHTDTTKPSPQVHPVTFTVHPCPCHADPQCDGVLDIVDVVREIERAFRAGAPILDSTCAPYGTQIDGRTDVDCSGSTDILDVVKMVDVAFRGMDRASRFCDPCG